MNYEITGSYISELSSNKSNIRAFLLLILSIVFIPAAYVFVAAVFIENSFKRSSLIKANNKLCMLVYAYVSIGLISSNYKLISAAYALIIALCFYSFLIFENLTDFEDIKKIKVLIFKVSIIVFIYGILQYFNPNFSMPSKWVDAGEYNLNKRIYSTFFNPNVFGFYINFIILLSLEKINFKKLNLDNLVFVSGLICLILTFSRTAWISLIVAMLAASLFNKKYIKYALIVSIAIFGADYLLGAGRTNVAKTAGDSSFLYRLDVWKTSLEIIKDNFVNGIGFGTLFKYVASYSKVVSTKIEHSHSIYLQIMTETGILGSSVFLTILFSAVKFFKSNLFENRNTDYIAPFTVFIMTMIHGMVDSVPLTPQILMILSIYAGMAHGFIPTQKR